MKIFDCFTYFNEDDLLRVRLETLAAHVDHFVIAEATHTQSGLPKPLNFRPALFEKFRDKIIYVAVDDMPVHLNDAWANENHQRRALMRGLSAAAFDDLVMVSDLDEIPHPARLKAYEPRFYRGTFIQRLFYYRFNNEALDPVTLAPQSWRGTQITTYRHLLDFFGDTQNLRIYKPTGLLRSAKRQWLKAFRNQDIADGGWHFSWVMTGERILTKINSMAHQEFNTDPIASIEAINRRLLEGHDILQRNIRFRRVALDSQFPEFIVVHRDEFKDLIL